MSNPLPLSSVNHISLLCSSVQTSAAFYETVLGFVPVKRPGSFDFDGAWLFNYGMGIHLIQAMSPDQIPEKSHINPKDYHISFETECEDLRQVEDRLKEFGVKCLKLQVEEGGIVLDQIFFHDPDGFMIEVCTCKNLPIIPLRANCRPRGVVPHRSHPPKMLSTISQKLRDFWIDLPSYRTNTD